jgi:molybdate transport system substrate-binding protein
MVGVAASLLASACGGNPASSGSSKIEGNIKVSAASSLTEAFTKIAADFRKQHPRAKVAFDFDASSALALRIQNGAPADAFASADQANMQKLVGDALVRGVPVVFARNRLEIVVRKGNPEHVRSLADLARLGTVSLCLEAAPCGRLATEALRKAGVAIPESRITRGENAKATITAVSPGDADAGIVYATDVKAAGSVVTGVTIPDPVNVIATYPIAVLKSSGNVAVAQAFAAYVTSPAGRRILSAFGFLAP